MYTAAYIVFPALLITYTVTLYLISLPIMMLLETHARLPEMRTQTNATIAVQTKKNKIHVFLGTRMVFALVANSAPFAFSQTKVSIVAT